MPVGVRGTVILFDVDGTLVLTGGAGRRALSRAFDEVCGSRDALAGVRLGGMTDRLIVREGLRAIGWAHDPRLVDRVLETYLTHLPEEVARSSNYRVLPGVHAVVDAVAEASSGGAPLALGLGTGNMRRGAEIKLERGGLGAAFPFGGFGCDHEDRAELLRAGVTRGAKHLGEPADRCRVVVVGDTPRDVHAARAIGAECVCVGTGGFEPDELLRLGATAAFADLTDPVAVRAICGHRGNDHPVGA
jgi:phosphoglycolate phosphatase